MRELLSELELPYLLRSTGKARWQVPRQNQLAQPLLGQLLGAAIADGRHMPVIESLVRKAAETIEANEELIHATIHERANTILRWTGLDERLANSVLDGLYKLLAEVLVNPDHPLRGVVILDGERQSLLGAAWRRIAALGVRESGF